MAKFERGYSEEFVANVDGVDVTSVAWKDNRTMFLLSNFCGKVPESQVKRYDKKTKKYIEIACPNIISVYNHGRC